MESADWDSAVQTGFARLNSYVQGKNETGARGIYLVIVCVLVESPGLLLSFSFLKKYPLE